MSPTQRQVVRGIAQRAAATGRPLDDALAESLDQLVPLLSRELSALDLVKAAEEDYQAALDGERQ